MKGCARGSGRDVLLKLVFFYILGTEADFQFQVQVVLLEERM